MRLLCVSVVKSAAADFRDLESGSEAVDDAEGSVGLFFDQKNFAGGGKGTREGGDDDLVSDQNYRFLQLLFGEPFPEIPHSGFPQLRVLKKGIERGEFLNFAQLEPFSGFQAAAPLAAENVCRLEIGFLESFSQGGRLLTPGVGEIPLGGAVSEVKIGGIPGAGRQGVTHDEKMRPVSVERDGVSRAKRVRPRYEGDEKN